jgi:hypothetical protein
MTLLFKYHRAVQGLKRHSHLAYRALFAALLSFLFLGYSSLAQSGNSAGGHASAPRATASIHPATGSVIPRTGSVAPPTAAHSGSGSASSSNPQHSHPPHNPGRPNPQYYAGGVAYYPYYVPMPYADDGTNGNADANDDAQYQGGPTVFDRRGLGADSYVPVGDPGPDSALQASNDVPPQPASDASSDSQDPTTLVFKDGHQLEVDNYAIVGQTLYDMTPGHPRKIALSDLDLPATQKQNDNQGVAFQLPASLLGN